MANSASERVIAGGAIPLPGGRIIASPFQFYLDGADNLRLEGWNARTNIALRLTGRFADDVQGIQNFEQVLPLPATRVRQALNIKMGRGYLLNLVVVAFKPDNEIETVQPTVYQTFARVTVIRGYSGNTMVLGAMLQGYVTTSQGLGWPGSPIVHSADGRGYVRDILGTVPAAGQQIYEAVPFNAHWEILRAYATFTSDAGVGNRFIRVAFFSPSQTTFIGSQPTPQAPSQFARYAWSANLPIVTDATNLYFQQPIPADAHLLTTGVFATDVTNMTAGDQWSAPRLQVREWIEVG